MFPHRTPTRRRIYQMRERKQPSGKRVVNLWPSRSFWTSFMSTSSRSRWVYKIFWEYFLSLVSFLDFFLIHKKIVKDIIIIDRVESLRRFCLYRNLVVSFSSRAVSFRFSLDRRVGPRLESFNSLTFNYVVATGKLWMTGFRYHGNVQFAHVFDSMKEGEKRRESISAMLHDDTTSMSSLATSWWNRRLIKLMDLYMSCHLRLPFTLNAGSTIVEALSHRQL